MKKLRNVALAGVGLTSLAYSNVTNAAITVDDGLGKSITEEGTLVTKIDTGIGLLLNLLYFVAVLYGLYGGFLILTAAGDDDKVGKGKKVLINAVIGLVVIFLVGFIMRFVIGLLSGAGNVTS